MRKGTRTPDRRESRRLSLRAVIRPSLMATQGRGSIERTSLWMPEAGVQGRKRTRILELRPAGMTTEQTHRRRGGTRCGTRLQWTQLRGMRRRGPRLQRPPKSESGASPYRSSRRRRPQRPRRPKPPTSRRRTPCALCRPRPVSLSNLNSSSSTRRRATPRSSSRTPSRSSSLLLLRPALPGLRQTRCPTSSATSPGSPTSRPGRRRSFRRRHQTL